MRTPRGARPNFDFLARPYRWLEYISFGRLLEACRFAQLDSMRDAQSALVLGDGDGRFLARLVANNPRIQADVVDISKTMLGLARARVPGVAGVRFEQADIRVWTPPDGHTYDLIVTHFFLDCLSEADISSLVERLLPSLTAQTTWVISEFAIPAQGLRRAAAHLLIRALYFSFRVLTGLRVQKLPDYCRVLEQAGFKREQIHLSLGGMLRSDVWQRII